MEERAREPNSSATAALPLEIKLDQDDVTRVVLVRSKSFGIYISTVLYTESLKPNLPRFSYELFVVLTTLLLLRCCMYYCCTGGVVLAVIVYWTTTTACVRLLLCSSLCCEEYE